MCVFNCFVKICSAVTLSLLGSAIYIRRKPEVVYDLFLSKESKDDAVLSSLPVPHYVFNNRMTSGRLKDHLCRQSVLTFKNEILQQSAPARSSSRRLGVRSSSIHFLKFGCDSNGPLQTHTLQVKLCRDTLHLL